MFQYTFFFFFSPSRKLSTRTICFCVVFSIFLGWTPWEHVVSEESFSGVVAQQMGFFGCPVLLPSSQIRYGTIPSVTVLLF